MNAAAIVYTSQTGFTARYAALLAERTGLPCRPLKEAAALPRGTAVIYLGWLCAGGIKGLKGARRRFRTAAVCAVGMAAEVEEAKLRRDNRLEGVPLFYLRGGYAPEKLTGFYRAMMAPMARLVSRAPAETEADRAMRDAFRDGGDWVSPGVWRPCWPGWTGIRRREFPWHTERTSARRGASSPPSWPGSTRASFSVCWASISPWICCC